MVYDRERRPTWSCSAATELPRLRRMAYCPRGRGSRVVPAVVVLCCAAASRSARSALPFRGMRAQREPVARQGHHIHGVEPLLGARELQFLEGVDDARHGNLLPALALAVTRQCFAERSFKKI